MSLGKNKPERVAQRALPSQASLDPETRQAILQQEKIAAAYARLEAQLVYKKLQERQATVLRRGKE